MIGPSFRDYIFRIIGHSRLPWARGLVYRLGGMESCRGKEFLVKFDALNYHGSFEEYIDRHIWCFGSYSPSELDFLNHASTVLRGYRNTLTYLDIGANVGQHALFMSRRSDRVLAFEPSSAVADRLQLNRDVNQLKNIEIHRVALGLEDCEAILGSGLPFNSGSRSLTWSLDIDKNSSVQVRHAGRYLAQEARALGRVDIIKLDVEGFEKNVLIALQEILQRDRPVLLFELVGKDLQGGFKSESELRQLLYESHEMLSLGGINRAKLKPFRWDLSEEAVCVPLELKHHFQKMISE